MAMTTLSRLGTCTAQWGGVVTTHGVQAAAFQPQETGTLPTQHAPAAIKILSTRRDFRLPTTNHLKVYMRYFSSAVVYSSSCYA